MYILRNVWDYFPQKKTEKEKNIKTKKYLYNYDRNYLDIHSLIIK